MSSTNRLVFSTSNPSKGSTVGNYNLIPGGTTAQTGGNPADGVSNAAIQALDVKSHLMCYDSVADDWNRVQCDDNGGLLITPKLPTDYTAAANTLSDVEESLIATAHTDRCRLFIMNNDDADGACFEIVDAGNAYGTGYPLYPQTSLCMDAGESLDLKVIADTGDTPDARTLELGCP